MTTFIKILEAVNSGVAVSYECGSATLDPELSHDHHGANLTRRAEIHSFDERERNGRQFPLTFDQTVGKSATSLGTTFFFSMAIVWR
jgi:hypothetical protein